MAAKAHVIPHLQVIKSEINALAVAHMKQTSKIQQLHLLVEQLQRLVELEDQEPS